MVMLCPGTPSPQILTSLWCHRPHMLSHHNYVFVQTDLDAKDRQLSAVAMEMERLQRSGERARAAAAAAADAAAVTAAGGSAPATADGPSAAGDASVVALRSVKDAMRP